MSYQSTAGPQKLLPEPFELALRRSLNRVAGLALCAGAAVGWLSLLTWTVTDPSPMHSTGGEVRNLLGPIGASISDILIQMTGITAIFALLAPMLWGTELVVARQITNFRYKLLMFPLAIMMLAGGASALPTVEGWPLRHGFGGVMGDGVLLAVASLTGMVAPAFSAALAGLVLLAGGCGLIAYCVGLTHRDLWALMMWPVPAAAGRARVSDQSPPGQQVGANAAASIEPVLPVPGIDATLKHDPVRREPMLGGLWPTPLTARADVPGEMQRDDRVDGEVGGRNRDHAGDHVGIDVLAIDDEDDDGDASIADLARRFAPHGGAAKVADKAAAVSATGFVETGPSQANDVRATPSRHFPSLTLLRARDAGDQRHDASAGHSDMARQLEDVLGDFGIKGEIKDIRPGPVVTVFELEPKRGTKSQRVIGLADDIGRSLGLRGVRIGVVPGRNALGIELPNQRSETVLLREILQSSAFRASEATLPVALGQSIGGEPIVADLARMPHLLVAGTTGSGKSVGINAMILSLLYRHSPQHCRLLMIDPKMLELSVYNDIPHLLAPVVTDPHKAVAALNWVVGEMEDRYQRMSKLGVRNIDGFNQRVREARENGLTLERRVQTGYDRVSGEPVVETEALDFETLPYIVVVVDEFADLMLVAGKEIEALVQRLAQMARAAGIHLIMATQRPSVDVITGTIKANFPSRIGFKVASKIDSRTILNEQGAEQLLGRGDMLFLSESGAIQRVHGAFVGDDEVEAVSAFLKSLGTANYVHGVTEAEGYAARSENPMRSGTEDGDLYAKAFQIVTQDQRASTSYLQRRLSIGYNKAADLIERLEEAGVVSPLSPAGRREVIGPARGNAATG